MARTARLTLPLTETNDRPVKKQVVPMQERAKQTRTTIMKAAMELWAARGFDTVSVDEVCARAGVGKGGFYFHFSKKEYLLVYIVFRRSNILPEADDILNVLGTDLDTGSICERVASSIARGVRQLPKHLVERAVTESVRFFPELHKGEGAQGMRSFLMPIFRVGQQRGEISKDWSLDMLVGLAGWGLLQGISSWARGECSSENLESDLRQRLQFIVQGASAARRR